MNEMEVVGVQQVLPSNTPVILLREKEGERLLPIFIIIYSGSTLIQLGPLMSLVLECRKRTIECFPTLQAESREGGHFRSMAPEIKLEHFVISQTR